MFPCDGGLPDPFHAGRTYRRGERSIFHLYRSTGHFLTKGRHVLSTMLCQSPFIDTNPPLSLFDSSFLYPKIHPDGGGPVKVLTLPTPTSQAPSLRNTHPLRKKKIDGHRESVLRETSYHEQEGNDVLYPYCSYTSGRKLVRECAGFAIMPTIYRPGANKKPKTRK